MHGFVNIKFINTRQAIEIHAYKFWNNKFYYKLASCWLFLLIHTTMHGSINIKFINARQAIEIHAYKFWNNKFYYKVASCWLFLLLHSLLTLPLDGYWVIFTSQLLYKWENVTWYLLKWRLCGPQNFVAQKVLLSLLRFLGHPTRKRVTLPTDVSRLLTRYFRLWSCTSFHTTEVR